MAVTTGSQLWVPQSKAKITETHGWQTHACKTKCSTAVGRSIEDKSADLDVLLDAAKTWKKKAQLLTAEN